MISAILYNVEGLFVCDSRHMSVPRIPFQVDASLAGICSARVIRQNSWRYTSLVAPSVVCIVLGNNTFLQGAVLNHAAKVDQSGLAISVHSDPIYCTPRLPYMN
jgi:hypothetical protein